MDTQRGVGSTNGTKCKRISTVARSSEETKRRRYVVVGGYEYTYLSQVKSDLYPYNT